LAKARFWDSILGRIDFGKGSILEGLDFGKRSTWEGLDFSRAIKRSEN
jgi:hypothetical protein